MTVISVAIGAACSKVPDALRSSLPLGEIAGVLLLVVFGVRALQVRSADTPSNCWVTVEFVQDRWQLGQPLGEMWVHQLSFFRRHLRLAQNASCLFVPLDLSLCEAHSHFCDACSPPLKQICNIAGSRED